jgi:tetratricopeptide (TPR) repeat protein
VPPTFYGLARAAEGEGHPDKARQILAAAAPPPPEDARYWVLLADLYSADNDDHAALEMARVVLRTDPDNLAALIRVVTAQARLARFSDKCDETVQAAKAILAASPTNVRARLEMARALASAQHFKEAVQAYEGLIALDPAARLPRRERARTLHSDHQFAAAQAAYHELLTPSADDWLHTALDDLARRDPHVGHVTVPHLPPDLSSQILKAELTRAGDADSEAAQALNRVFLDYQARAAEQAEDRLEAQVKDSDWKHRESAGVATELLGLEPANTSVAFDLGQAYSNLRMTHKAMDTYGQELQVDPHEREAAEALERAGLELAPQALLGFDFFNQSGRQGLAAITRFRYSSAVRVPLGDEDEYVSAGFSRVDYVPHADGGPLEGNILSGGWQTKCWDRFYTYGLVNVEEYRDRLSPRPTFDAGLRYDFCDLVSARGGMYLNNVVENGATLQQDIYRYGARATADLNLTRRWTGLAQYTYGHYSDNNDYNELYLRTVYLFCFPPAELKAILSMDLQGFRASTVFPNNDPNDIQDAVHPYFSPRLYVYYEGRLSWKQWLSRDYFAHGNQCWYSVEYGLGWDNNFVGYNVVEVRCNGDLRPWLSLGADAGVILSPAYSAEWATAYLVFRWPCGLH